MSKFNKMRKLYAFISLICVVFILINCSNINDFHDIYLEDGETIYIAKVDSVDAYSGNERILLRIHTKNPKVSTFAIFWNQRLDSLIVPISNRDSLEYFDVVMDNLEEKSYVFEIFSRDDKGHRSIVFEKIADVYGDGYFATLNNHPFKSALFDPFLSLLTVSWFPSTNNTEVGVEFKFQNLNTGLPSIEYINIDSLGSITEIENIDPEYPVSYHTYFMPDDMAIDTFYTDYVSVELIQIINVALNKPVTIREGDIYAPQFSGTNAVDGVVSGESRWVSAGEGEHWIEVDLLQDYTIYSFRTLIGSGGSFSSPITEFKFQAEVEGQWEDIVDVTGNYDPKYAVEFPEITTSKVRYYVPEGVIDHVRLYEIEVYSKINY